MAANTRATILGAARTLFNERGLENVSLRNIADELDISIGNLTYHFKRRDDIVFELYLELVEQMDKLVSDEGQVMADPTLVQVRRAFGGVFPAFLSYRFIMDNLLQVARQHSRIQTHYQDLTLRREQETLRLFALMVEDGLMHPEQGADQFKTLVTQLTILGNFFLPSAEVFLALDEVDIESRFHQVMSQLLSPYLTEAGRREILLFDSSA